MLWIIALLFGVIVVLIDAVVVYCWVFGWFGFWVDGFVGRVE